LLIERTRITIKEDVYQKPTEQVDRGEDTATEITKEDKIQVAAGYEAKEEEGYENRKFQARGVEKPRYSGPSAKDMLYGPCRIHYAYLGGKRVSNYQMKDYRTFLRLQSAMGSSQGGW
jgi:hypothetical protein